MTPPENTLISKKKSTDKHYRPSRNVWEWGDEDKVCPVIYIRIKTTVLLVSNEHAFKKGQENVTKSRLGQKVKNTLCPKLDNHSNQCKKTTTYRVSWDDTNANNELKIQLYSLLDYSESGRSIPSLPCASGSGFWRWLPASVHLSQWWSVFKCVQWYVLTSLDRLSPCVYRCMSQPVLVGLASRLIVVQLLAVCSGHLAWRCSTLPFCMVRVPLLTWVLFIPLLMKIS